MPQHTPDERRKRERLRNLKARRAGRSPATGNPFVLPAGISTKERQAIQRDLDKRIAALEKDLNVSAQQRVRERQQMLDSLTGSKRRRR